MMATDADSAATAAIGAWEAARAAGALACVLVRELPNPAAVQRAADVLARAARWPIGIEVARKFGLVATVGGAQHACDAADALGSALPAYQVGDKEKLLAAAQRAYASAGLASATACEAAGVASE